MKFYKICMAVMAVILILLILMTVTECIRGLSNDNKMSDGSVFDSVLTVILIIIFALTCGVCLCISRVYGTPVYKIGFYVLHGGLVIMLAGFLIYGFTGEKITASVPVGDKSYSSIERSEYDNENDRYIDLGFYIGVTSAKTEYYDTGSVKYYEASVKFSDPISLKSEASALTVNHPLRKNGYKIYLMSFASDGDNEYAVLLFKKDPAEYTIMTGIVLLIAGSVLMCLVKRERGEIDE